MSSRVGFHGGSSIFELGSPADVAFFFRCIECFVVPKTPASDWSTVSDRLYKWYLRQEELEAAIRLMKSAQEVFSGLPGGAPLKEDALIDEAGETQLNWSIPKRLTLLSILRILRLVVHRCHNFCKEIR